MSGPEVAHELTEHVEHQGWFDLGPLKLAAGVSQGVPSGGDVGQMAVEVPSDVMFRSLLDAS
ncbi:MAG: hypothetical protein AB7L17_11250 [Ilumatobacteraceae bacterium]